ncbi:carbon storage regulator [Shewanella canadensis]|uniref:Carbon storage regulator n=1 Tax=Shewanella canadensis TaxID=271096 RepID=A0A3S0K998_9GAMM|nr:carbon storage regulator [Shewanella canadensis]RTR38396.1 carbon storage regulator [Shewanella canadensis]
MLILTRKTNTSVTITNVYDENGEPLKDIEINIYADNRIGIDADSSVDIYRSEILQLGE